MRSASGQYRLDAASAEFFGSRVLKLIVRDSSVIGRFGRIGSIQGSFTGFVAQALWHDCYRKGWMTMIFTADYTSAVCRYGVDHGPQIGQSALTRAVRKRRAPQKQA